MTKYVWLNIETGKFSNSWSEKDHTVSTPESLLNIPKDDKWKLVKYECLNDNNFEIQGYMALK